MVSADTAIAMAAQTAAIVVTLFGLHKQNVQRLADQNKQMADIQVKVSLMWRAYVEDHRHQNRHRHRSNDSDNIG